MPFGKYLLTELIAMGGMAEIYRAKIFGVNGFEKQMVVKRILPKYAQNPSFVQMFEDEAKILVSLTHGNIVPVYELGEVGGNYYIAMEYAEGLTTLDVLRECYLKNRGLTLGQALYIGAEVAKGLGYAHTRADGQGQALGIVHRDLNPRNIVVSPAGEVKILDFGIARSSRKKHQTGSGIIKGTPGYMAPEQVMGHTVDARADQYGLAIIIHELATVRRLIAVKDAQEHRNFLARGPIQPPSYFRPEIPPSVDAVIMRALSQRPEDRFAGVLDFEEALRTEIAKTGQAVTSRGLSNTIAEIRALPAADPATLAKADARAQNGARASNSQPAAKAPEPAPQPPPAPEAPLAAAAAPMVSGAVPVVQEDFTQTQKKAPPPQPPVLSVAAVSGARPATQVLALNQELTWSHNIGKDAELLALGHASGMKTNGPARVAGIAFGALALVVGGWAAVNRDEVAAMVERARTGKRAVTGSLVVKSRPSGAVVTLDGAESGKTNIRLDDVLVERSHELLVTLPDGREFRRTIQPADFSTTDRKLEVMFDSNATDGGTGASPSGATPPPAK